MLTLADILPEEPDQVTATRMVEGLFRHLEDLRVCFWWRNFGGRLPK
ncbi:MAG: hypothetical protein F6J86_25750 [Symploca sp. SIO1B1]|nr:hypothetical protein [Symploca sp. SIO1C2]NER97208.1 hypothetical protein [Symploca sp. SIO1B1]